jgi:tyrosyl-tRNA synthetase
VRIYRAAFAIEEEIHTNMANVMDTLRARGFIKQVVFEQDLYKLLGGGGTAFYIGFDPTADSLHVGHFLQLMAMSHMQRAGHKPYFVVGGGTALVGDPSNRTDMRQMLTKETIKKNSAAFVEQAKSFIDFSPTAKNAAVLVNNADWLEGLNYIDFLRDIGGLFSVNRMLTADCYKSRLEKGLTFLEFNYMLMQSYDFLVLHQKYGVSLQLGGDDQWSNILSGADLIRRKEGKDAFALTIPLLTTAQGVKMGKTQAGALWLDKNKTSPYEFYQYFRNVDDGDVEKCFKLLTFFDLDKIAELTKFKDERINAAKKILAFEITKLVHGQAEARAAEDMAAAAFFKVGAGAAGAGASAAGAVENMPTQTIDKGVTGVIDILTATGAAASKSEARRLIEGGGVSIDGQGVLSITETLSNRIIAKKEFVLHKGKKTRIRVILK